VHVTLAGKRQVDAHGRPSPTRKAQADLRDRNRAVAFAYTNDLLNARG
jgi:hypothetical protein